MKKIKIIFLGIGLMIAASSCTVGGPLAITDNASEKRGEAEMKVILGFIRPMNGDLSIKKAAENGGITKVTTVDYKVKGGLFSTTYVTVVTGE